MSYHPTMQERIKEDLKKLPDSPGVYFFKHGKSILYIGKATSLRDRVRSYFARDILETRGPKIVKMLELANGVDFTETDSVLEALILESRLIKKHQPEYNTREKDNKSYNYIAISKEDFPRVFIVRGREIIKDPKLLEGEKIDEVFGPFPHGNTLREALKILRKIFPFRDKKARQTHHERFYRQLQLAPDTSVEDAKKAYGKTIKNLKEFLRGDKKTLVKRLDKEMMQLAKAEKFEEANQVKKTLFALQHIQDIALIKDDLVASRGRVQRIEAYDVAHTQGTNTVGVMTVVIDGEVDKNEYRKFRIKSDKKGSDTHALYELVTRRLGHDEWRLPTIMVADGGLAQKRVIEKALRELGYSIPVVSVVKDERHRPRTVLGRENVIKDSEAEILLANHEAHRFAVEYHKKLRGKIR